jgi:hypothetical protein
MQPTPELPVVPSRLNVPPPWGRQVMKRYASASMLAIAIPRSEHHGHQIHPERKDDDTPECTSTVLAVKPYSPVWQFTSASESTL